MLRFPGDTPDQLLAAVWDRLREAVCLPDGSAHQDAPRVAEDQRGSAVVEFTFLTVLLMVPVVYFVVTIGQIQGGSFAVVGAADQAAKVFVTQPDTARGRTAAEQSVLVALNDYGHTPDQASVEITCDREDCLSAGATVTVTVRLDVPLPMVPFGDELNLHASRLTASSVQVAGRYK
ncbi:hypothetical protein ACFRJ9_18460 [Paenarthrobacter sp. NPDC056912]|uniref:hypothetical protein n=1 Tax=Paenarthrobacter sp. NPDC056912 TaxID=3345965 RepID=UPI00366EB4E6